MDPTRAQLNTSFQNPEETKRAEIKVTDARHPLFGCCFPLAPISQYLRPTARNVYVIYEEFIVLRIPIEATNLTVTKPENRTKLTTKSIEELINLAIASEVICQCKQSECGGNCPLSNKPE